jgi:glycosyltransferase involved in cell wall biosynthesis
MGRKFIGKRVVMIDGSDRPLVCDMLKLADMFVFFSNIEASPLVLFEAAAAGTPFVATAAGNIPEIAQWTGSGIVVKSHGRPNGRVAADMKDALWQTTRLAHDRKRRDILGAHGRNAWEKKYTWGKLANQYLELYGSLTDKTRNNKR